MKAHIKEHLIEVADRAVKSAGHAVVLALGADQVNALQADWQLVGGFALGGAVLSIATSFASSGFLGRVTTLRGR